MTATQTRRTSQYVAAFTAPGYAADAALDDLIRAAEDDGLTVAGSYQVDDNLVALVLRFPDDAAAVAACRALGDAAEAPLTGVVTGLGVHRRAVSLCPHCNPPAVTGAGCGHAECDGRADCRRPS